MAKQIWPFGATEYTEQLKDTDYLGGYETTSIVSGNKQRRISLLKLRSWLATIFIGKKDTFSDLENVSVLFEGRTISILGVLSKNDGGHGDFIWIPTSEATPVIGMVAQVTGVTIGRFHRLYGNEIHILWFGADILGIADSSSAFSDAFTYIYSLPRGVIDFKGRPTLNLDGGSFKINSGFLTIDSSKIRVNGNGASLNFVDNDSVAQFIFLTNTGDILDTYSNPISALENLAIEGRDRAVSGNNTGILIESTVGGTVATAGLTLRNIAITNCEYGVHHKESSYNITYDTCSIFRNAIAVQFTSSPDMFERAVFQSCTIFNNSLAIGCNAANGVAYFIACSFDYNSRHVELLAGGLEFRGGHVEGTLNTQAHFLVSGNSTFHAEGGWWQFPRSTDPLPTALEEFDASGSFNGNITIKDVKFSSFGNDIPFTLNPEKVNVIAPKPDSTSLISLTRFNRHFTTPSRYFETGALDKDMWLVTSSTGLSTDRYTNPGLVMSIVNDAGEALGGSSYYLEADKIFGAGSDSNIFIAVPLGNKRRAAGKIQLKSMSGSTVSVSVTMFYATLSTSLGDSNDIKKIPYEIITSRNIGSIAQNLSSNYQSYNFNMRERALDSDTHALMQINMFLVPTGQVAIGEWYISLV